MKNIVPVPELILNEVDKSSYKVDADTYTYFKEKVFFLDFDKYLKKKEVNYEYSNINRFEKLDNACDYVKGFVNVKRSYVAFNNHFYIYNVKGFDWLAIDLFEFEKKRDVEDFLLNKNKIWNILRQFFLLIIVK